MTSLRWDEQTGGGIPTEQDQRENKQSIELARYSLRVEKPHDG